MTVYYGMRYLTASEFYQYCSDLNVSVNPLSDLQRFEMDRVLLPAARVMKPVEYVTERERVDTESRTYGQPLADWQELEGLFDSRLDPQNRSDEDLWHPFDRGLKRKNRFLYRPGENEFKPWSSYWVGGAAVEHYYHYWQVYQVYAIQKLYPIYARHFWFLENLKDEVKERASYYTPQPLGAIVTLNGNLQYFDALSFYMQLRENERRISFRPNHQTADDLIKHYKVQIKRHADNVLGEYGFTTPQFYQFLFYLLDLRSEYERDEHAKLAEEVTKDLQSIVGLLATVSEQSLQEVAEEAGRKTGPLVTKEIRALDENLEIRDYAASTFARVMNDYNGEFPQFNISPAEIDDLLKFIDSTELLIIPYTIFDTDKALNSGKPVHKTVIYTGIKNLATGLEDLLREIAKRIPAPSGSTDDLGNLINMVFKQWSADFWKERDRIQNKTKPKATPDFIRNITDAYTDPSFKLITHGESIRVFLIAYWARNFTGHFYTLENDLYNGLSGRVVTSLYYAFLYAWKHAVDKKWPLI
ncbi:MAG: hypothetical protein HY741_16425 [Chloroflexi bacterium]|nr:hypothetical protein [Chloroflexota bacterium]